MSNIHKVDEFHAFNALLPFLPERNVFVYFAASRNADGTSWCLDSAKAAPAIEAFAQGLDKEDTFVYYTVAERDWNDLLNPLRYLKGIRVTSLPTLAELHSKKKLCRERCADSAQLTTFRETAKRMNKREGDCAVKADWWKDDEKRLTALRKQSRIAHRKAKSRDTPEAWKEYVELNKLFKSLARSAKRKHIGRQKFEQRQTAAMLGLEEYLEDGESEATEDPEDDDVMTQQSEECRGEPEPAVPDGLGVSFVPPRWQQQETQSSSTNLGQVSLGKVAVGSFAETPVRLPPQQEIQSSSIGGSLQWQQQHFYGNQ